MSRRVGLSSARCFSTGVYRTAFSVVWHRWRRSPSPGGLGCAHILVCRVNSRPCLECLNTGKFAPTCHAVALSVRVHRLWRVIFQVLRVPATAMSCVCTLLYLVCVHSGSCGRAGCEPCWCCHQQLAQVLPLGLLSADLHGWLSVKSCAVWGLAAGVCTGVLRPTWWALLLGQNVSGSATRAVRSGMLQSV